MKWDRVKNLNFVVFLECLCLIYTLCVLVPVMWVGISSFRSSVEFFTNPFGIPHHWLPSNYSYAWSRMDVARYFTNSVFVTFVSVTAIIFLSAMAAFALTRLSFPGRVGFLFLFISGLFVPSSLLLVPLFLLLMDLHVLGSYAGLIPVYIAYSFPFTVFVLVPFFNAIPRDLEEAAVMDGATHYRIFWDVALPLVKPGLIVATIFNVFGIWNEFVLGYVLISKQTLKTLPLGLADILMKQHYTADYGKLFAALVIAVAPIAILYIVFQKRLTGGLMAGALKE